MPPKKQFKISDLTNALRAMMETPPPGYRPKRISTAKRRELAKTQPGYLFRVDLLSTKPPIWRRIAVPAGTDLGQLHEIIQIAMGWYDCHLHAFRDGQQSYEPPQPDEWGFPTFGPEPIDERRVLIDQIFTRPRKTLRYEYDFGDSWDHSIKFEKRAAGPIPRPQLLKGKRACPPEDCGGVWGYCNLIEALADPKHPEHEDLKEWYGGTLDPEHFDLEGRNAALALITKR